MSIALGRQPFRRGALWPRVFTTLLATVVFAAAAPAFARAQGPVFPDEEPTFGVESTGYVVVRGVLFTALLLVVGVAGFQSLTLRMVRRRGTRAGQAVALAADQRATRIGLVGSVLLLIAVLARLVAQLYASVGLDDGITSSLVNVVLFESMWGWGWLSQLGATLLALGCYCFLLLRRRGSSANWALVPALILAFTPALSGHAVASEHLTLLAVTADGLHVLGAGGWLGTLAILVLAGLPAARQLDPKDRTTAAAELVNAFSPAALVCASIVVVTGVFATWLHVNTVAALWQSDYGRMLLIKVGTLSVVAGIGVYNWRVVKPTLGDDEVATRRLRRSAIMELVVAVAVVTITAVLVATTPPGELSMAAQLGR